jgi:hypothetical protein
VKAWKGGGDMKEIIDKIIQTELEAQKQGKRLEQQEQEFRKSLDKEIEAYREEKMEQAKQRVRKVEEAETKILKEQIEKIEAKYNRKMVQLETKFQENRENYLQTLFSRITGGEKHA